MVAYSDHNARALCFAAKRWMKVKREGRGERCKTERIRKPFEDK